jgi:DNA mismatch repair protein MutS2
MTLESKPPTGSKQDAAQARARGAALEHFAAGTLELESVLELVGEYVASSLGRRAVSELAPLADEEVRCALDRVLEVQRLERAKDPISLGGLTDPKPLIAAAHERPFEDTELSGLRNFLAATERLQNWFASRVEDVPQLGRVAADLPDLSALRDRINEVVDERGRVVDTASPLLGRLRRDMRELSQKIDSSLRHIASRTDIRNHLTDGRVHLRGGRHCLAVKAKASGRVPGIIHDRSQSEQTAFVEPRDVIEPANRLSETRHEERRELTRILTQLSRDVLEREFEMAAAGAGLAKLELAVASAAFAEAFEARVPLLPGERGAAQGLLLRNARHPLLIAELRAERLDEVVPIDLRLGEDFDMLIITGPNTGGKTLALKTAGLFALMVRVGLPIPVAEGSTMPLYHGVAADIGDEQEISQSLSTFSSHVMRIKAGLARADAQTLVLLDELGGGTDPDEGAALGEALLEELLAIGAPTIVSTHLGRLKEFAFRNARAENACTEFDLETLEPRYHVLVGVPGESAALVIAGRLGLSPELLARANQRIVRRDDELTKLMAEVRDVRTQAEHTRSRAESRLEDAAQQTRELAELASELDRKNELIEAEAQRGLEERVRGARAALERARSLLPQLGAAQRGEMERVLDDLDNSLGGASLTQRRADFLKSMKKGDLVYLPRYKQRCPVHRVRKDDKTVVVKLGSMKLTVGFDEVTLYEAL